MVTGLPAVSAAAANENGTETRTRPTAAELLGDDYMKPSDFNIDEVNAYADGIAAGTRGITDIGRLPSYEEFVSQTGYTSSILSLTAFRAKYGSGSGFSAPTGTVSIYITSEAELDELSSLVNNKAASETAAEQSYYSAASYVLSDNLTYKGTRFVPIGTADHPFNGTFDGEGFELSGLTISEDSASTYQGVGSFGVFGNVGVNGTVKNLGITDMNINLPYTVGADVGVLCGQNYGKIMDCYINGKETTFVSVSNATVGGIAAENYGMIERTYSDFSAEVLSTSGSYSEP